MEARTKGREKKVYMVGVGLGQEQFLTPEAREILQGAKRVYTSMRIGEGLKGLLKETVEFKVSEIVPLIEQSQEDVVIMVSGDTGFYSLANTISRKMAGSKVQLIRINGISSMQYFFAKIGKSYEDVKLLSLHGREESIVAHVTYNKKVFALTGGKNKVVDLCRALVEAKMDFIPMTVGENLGNVDKPAGNLKNPEKIYTLSPKEILERDKKEPISELAVVYIENEQAANPHRMIRDEDLIRGEAPMTKEEIRHLSVAKLDIQPGDIVYDIGAGTGSVSLEMAKKASASMVYALEQKKEAYDLLEANKQKLGIYNVCSILAKAPEGLEALPAPAKVFIGGSGKNMEAIVDTIIEKAQQAKAEKEKASQDGGIREIDFVINTIAIESLAEANRIFAEPRFEQVEYLSVSTARSKKAGPYHMMMANNPIYIIYAKYKLG